MPDLENYLSRWQSAGLIDAALAARLREHESAGRERSGMQWQVLIALILGGILLAAGVALFVNAHWDQISPLSRYLLVMAMVGVFHIGGGVARSKFHALSTTLHAIGTLSTGAAIALVGQIFNIQEHWPAAVLLWAAAAALGWLLLRDQAQQTITLLLVPAWLLCEWADAAANYQGANVYIGRILVVWSALYLTFFLRERRKLVWGITYAAAAIAMIVGGNLILDSWDMRGWQFHHFLPLHLRVWGWIVFAAIPLLVSLFRAGRSLIPVLVTLAASWALPACRYIRSYDAGQNAHPYTYAEPNIFAHLIISAIAVFLGWWGVRQNSKSLVNYGIVLFAISVGWFYFTDLFDKLGRSLGLIGLGVLFLAGGWALERMRRRLIAQISSVQAAPEGL
jgi:uncharacterized membrane protein